MAPDHVLEDRGSGSRGGRARRRSPRSCRARSRGPGATSSVSSRTTVRPIATSLVGAVEREHVAAQEDVAVEVPLERLHDRVARARPARRRPRWRARAARVRHYGGQLLLDQLAHALAVGAALRPCGITSAITLPISCGRAGAGLGHRVADDRAAAPRRRSARAGRRRSARPRAPRPRPGRRGRPRGRPRPPRAALALALEHGDLVAAALLGRLLELVHDQAQRVHALAVSPAFMAVVHVDPGPVRALTLGSSVGGQWDRSDVGHVRLLRHPDRLGGRRWARSCTSSPARSEPTRRPARELRERWEADPVRAHPGRLPDLPRGPGREPRATGRASAATAGTSDDGEALARSMEAGSRSPTPCRPCARPRTAGLRLVIISNTDRAIIEHTLRQLEASTFDGVIVAEDVRAYKPSTRALPAGAGGDRRAARARSCTWPSASSTTSARRRRWACRPRGSTATRSRATRRREARPRVDGPVAARGSRRRPLVLEDRHDARRRGARRPTIRSGKHATLNPVGGQRGRLTSRSICE